jgi:farnesyl-diphosphate farnesyltransferase
MTVIHAFKPQPAPKPEPEPEIARGSQTIEADRTFCSQLLPRVSRTFALSITALPESLRDTIRIAYLLCRIVDTVEDDAIIDPATRERLFDQFDRLMGDDRLAPEGFERACHACSLGGLSKADHQLCIGAGAVFRAFRALSPEHRAAVRPHVLEMSRGMREFTRRAQVAGKLRLSNMADLERYCYFVAGTVGKLLTALFELAAPSMSAHAKSEARARAISFGLALQMVNIVKDVAEDFERGDCFLPSDVAHAAGINLDQLLTAEHRGSGLEVVRAVTGRAREHLRRAKEYTLLWPVDEGADVRLFCTVPLALALATLHEVEAGHDTLRPGKTPKVSRGVVWQVFRDAKRAIGDNTTLTWMLSHYASGAYRDDERHDAIDEAQARALERAMHSGPPPRQRTRGLTQGMHEAATQASKLHTASGKAGPQPRPA